MQRGIFIEQIRRIIAGGVPNDDSEVTISLVNSFINPAIAVAAKSNWVENLKMEGCTYANNSFYTTVSGIAITSDSEFGVYNVSLPSIPVGLGRTEGVSAVYVIDDRGTQSKPVTMLSVAQVNYADDMPKMNGFLGWYEGATVKLKSPETPLTGFTAKVRMINTGAADTLSSQISVPEEALPEMQKWILTTLGYADRIPKDFSNDGIQQP